MSRWSQLHVSIAEIGASGRRLALTLDDGQLRELLEPTGLELASTSGALRVDLHLTRREQTVFVRGRIEARFHVPCGRCLGPAEVAAVEDDLQLTFVPPGALGVERDPEVELGEDDLELAVHDGEGIDLRQIIRDLLVLAVPIAPRCDADCPGIAHPTEDGFGESSPWKAALRRLTE